MTSFGDLGDQLGDSPEQYSNASEPAALQGPTYASVTNGAAIAQNDTLPGFVATFYDQNGPIDISGCTFVFKMLGSVTATAVEKTNGTGTSGGVFSQSWASGDTGIADKYYAQIVCTVTATGAIFTVPDFGFIPIFVNEALF